MIIFLHGEDTYRSREKLKGLKDKFVREVDSSRMNLDVIEASDIDFGKFRSMVGASPFLAKKRMVVFLNLAKNKNIQAEAAEFLADEDRDDSILIFWEEGRVNNKLFKFLSQQKYKQEFEPLSDLSLGRWIGEKVSERGGKIEQPAVRALVEYVGNNLWLLSNEINKLIAYKNGREIKKADVEELVHTKFDDNIFGLVDALGVKNKKQALKLLDNQLKFGSTPFYIISMLVRQYRILLQAHENIDLPSKDLSAKTGLHPFVAKKALAQARKYKFSDLQRIYCELLSMDKKIKSSSLDPELLVDLLIAEV